MSIYKTVTMKFHQISLCSLYLPLKSLIIQLLILNLLNEIKASIIIFFYDTWKELSRNIISFHFLKELYFIICEQIEQYWQYPQQWKWEEKIKISFYLAKFSWVVFLNFENSMQYATSLDFISLFPSDLHWEMWRDFVFYAQKQRHLLAVRNEIKGERKRKKEVYRE